MKKISLFFLLLSALVAPLAAKTVLRVGYFPNVTHAQGVIGKTLTSQQKGWFEERLGPDIEIQWYAYNAGPSAMEAIFAGSIDLTYVGPNPSLNAYIRSKGEEIRVIAGAARGGAALLVRPGSGIEKPADFKGKKLATPQLGNTQDVAARVWLQKQGFKITQMGGEVSVLPTANPDQLSLFQQGKIDAVWTVEPWVSRIEREAGGKVYLEQKDAVTTILVSSVKLLKNQPELVKKFAKAHRELTDWVNAHPAEAQALVQRGLSDDVKREIKLELVVAAWQRLTFTSEITLDSIASLVADARQLGFIRGEVELTRFINIPQ
ncbi:MAG: ABC transporter substrate-binding protein [Verrucomicrobia bacterium]|nr:ABC transporter substrate-binding protein [Verrucomicrobiota bacterium]